MSRIVLIHGFATGIQYSVFRSARGTDAGFSAFAPDVARGEAKAFRWDIKEKASFFQSINPLYAWDIYRRELAIAQEIETRQSLSEFLLQEEPEVIVCHSMGTLLFFGYLENHKLPASVRRVIFNQADIHASDITLPLDIEERIRAGELLFLNTYCPWDPSLLCSRILNGSRAGLAGMRHSLVRNHFIPLVKPINLHMSAIRSGSFRLLIDSCD